MPEAEALRKELNKLREQELLDFVRDLIPRLETLADRLEDYVSPTPQMEVGFSTKVEPSTDDG